MSLRPRAAHAAPLEIGRWPAAIRRFGNIEIADIVIEGQGKIASRRYLILPVLFLVPLPCRRMPSAISLQCVNVLRT
jgi:hypothetical protein